MPNPHGTRMFWLACGANLVDDHDGDAPSASEDPDNTHLCNRPSGSSSIRTCGDNVASVQTDYATTPSGVTSCFYPAIRRREKLVKPVPTVVDNETRGEFMEMLCCPICYEVFTEPVLIESGHTFDRRCIAEWFKQGYSSCPLTGLSLGSLDLLPNYLVQAMLPSGPPRSRTSPLPPTTLQTACQLAQQEKGAHIQKLTDQNDLLTVRVKDLEEEEVLMHKKFNRAREEIATHVKEKESLKQQLELAQEQIKQFTEGNTFVGKDKEILEIQAQNEFMTKLVDRLGKDRECVRCGTVYCPRDRARGSLEEGVDEESYAKEECAYHPIKQIRYGGCREVGCGEDAYYMCCGRCEKCSKGCRKGMHVS